MDGRTFSTIQDAFKHLAFNIRNKKQQSLYMEVGENVLKSEF